MKLKAHMDFTMFLHQVRQCTGEVSFVTQDGDRLNLKSVLSEYLFLSAAIASDLIGRGHLEFANPEDETLLEAFREV